MKSKRDEREYIKSNLIIGVVLFVAVFCTYVLFSANPKEMIVKAQEQKAQVAWNREVSALIRKGDMQTVNDMVMSSFYELTQENKEAVEKWRELLAKEEQSIGNELGKIRDMYLEGDKELAREQLISLCAAYPENNHAKAYLEL